MMQKGAYPLEETVKKGRLFFFCHSLFKIYKTTMNKIKIDKNVMHY